jgi:hypothetical protein
LFARLAIRLRLALYHSGNRGRHHLHEGRMHLVVTTAVRSLKWTKRATCHTLRHSFADRLAGNEP